MVERSQGITPLKELLKERGITQTELACILGRDKSVVTKLFQGWRQLKASEAVLIAHHLGVPIARVLGIEEADSEAVPRDRVHRLFNEVDCRIAHGASSNGHLEYVHSELRAILGNAA